MHYLNDLEACIILQHPSSANLFDVPEDCCIICKGVVALNTQHLSCEPGWVWLAYVVTAMNLEPEANLDL